MIGAFVVGTVVLAVAVVVVLGGGHVFTEKQRAVMYFDGSVNGLNVGAPVKFRGVQIGAVKEVSALYDPQNFRSRIRVVAEVDPSRITEFQGGVFTPSTVRSREEMREMIEQGLRAQLQVQSLVTGVLYIEIDFKPNTPINLTGIDSEYRELLTLSSTMDELLETVQGTLAELGKLPLEALLGELLAMLERINVLLNLPDVHQMLGNTNALLTEARDLLQDADAQVLPFSAKFASLTDTAEAMLEAIRVVVPEAQKLVRNIDAQVMPLSGHTQKVLAEARGTLWQARQSLDRLEGAAAPALAQAEKTLAAADLANSDAALLTHLSQTLGAMEGAARSIRILADYLQRNPEALLRGKGRAGDR